jgi:rubrerythrin
VETEQVGFKQALKFAIEKEVQAALLYTRMANLALDVQAKSFFIDMSKEEERHKVMLENLRERGTKESIEFAKPLDMQIVEYLQPSKLSEDMTYQEALIYAANREKEAAEYYRHMSGVVGDETAKQLFATLAEWELTHKVFVESEYEKHFMQEN